MGSAMVWWFKHPKNPTATTFMKAGVKVEKICIAGFQMKQHEFPSHVYIYISN